MMKSIVLGDAVLQICTDEDAESLMFMSPAWTCGGAFVPAMSFGVSSEVHIHALRDALNAAFPVEA